MTYKTMLTLAVIALASGCSGDKQSVDQCKREEIFRQCLAALPAGPQTTVYNDWAEVVGACGSQAYYQSKRKVSNIKKECQP